ncbi:hypothetical protein WOLCODRAFT_21830 [Wolfiporia cocos MD-104 SS10]|uniref:Uncharacterized protein n=1 Tax=Wolfiporia cocos (strain MD-104) TaxID=742152 RepID=A0A2H3J066_WOLCO|nr:hypothetical protein WOLCODRAFT_21830 [Wolfiporia cocos MD-104 SS10]
MSVSDIGSHLFENIESFDGGHPVLPSKAMPLKPPNASATFKLSVAMMYIAGTF